YRGGCRDGYSWRDTLDCDGAWRRGLGRPAPTEDPSELGKRGPGTTIPLPVHDLLRRTTRRLHRPILLPLVHVVRRLVLHLRIARCAAGLHRRKVAPLSARSAQ